jgi:AAA family ATP:ADP antiporter
MNNAIPTRFIRAGELRRVVLSFAAFFLILCSYYILRPVRDEMAVQYGADKLHWLFTGIFLLTLLVVPLFGWVVKRVPRAYVLPVVYGFLISNLLIFCIAFSSGAMSAVTAIAFNMKAGYGRMPDEKIRALIAAEAG